MDIGGTNTRAMAVDFEGREVGERLRVSTLKSNAADFIEHLSELILKAIPQDKKLEDLAGVGIGMPGPLNPKEGILYQTPHFAELKNVEVAKMLSQKLNKPVYLEHDANCAAIGERAFGAAKNVDDFIMLTFGTGIGAGIYCGGKIVHGKSGGAGEVGHLCLYPGGTTCQCGRKGCLEEYLSARAVVRRANEMGANIENAHEIFVQKDRGTEWAEKLFSKLVHELSTGLGTLINVFEPQKIILAGGLFVQKHENFLSAVQEALKNEAFDSALKDFELCATHIPRNTGLLGAAAVAISKLTPRL